MWMAIFGGSGISIERKAAEKGLCCPSFNSDFLADANLAEVRYHQMWDGHRATQFFPIPIPHPENREIGIGIN